MTDEAATITPNDEGPAIPVCPKCLAEVLPGADFCMSCRAPVTAYANTGYLESALSEGWGLGEAIVTKQPRLVTLIGLLLLLTPALFWATAILLATAAPRDEDRTGGTIMAVGTLGLAGWALVHATLNYVRSRRRPG